MYENISLDEGWEVLVEGIAKATKFLRGNTQMRISSIDYIKYYSCAFCVGIQSYDNCAVIYDRYKSTLEQIVRSMVLPPLMGARDEFLLQGLVIMWSNYQKMTMVTSDFLAHLDRYYVPFSERPPLKTVAASCFFNLVFPRSPSTMTESVCDAVVSLMNREREGEAISHDLINSFMVFITDGTKSLPKLYGFNIENAIFYGATRYYSRKGFAWFMACTFNYASKYRECLRMEYLRAARYMVLSRDFQRDYFVQLVNTALVEAYEKALRPKMTKFALRYAYSRRPADGDASRLPTWISMMKIQM